MPYKVERVPETQRKASAIHDFETTLRILLDDTSDDMLLCLGIMINPKKVEDLLGKYSDTVSEKSEGFRELIMEEFISALKERSADWLGYMLNKVSEEMADKWDDKNANVDWYNVPAHMKPSRYR